MKTHRFVFHDEEGNKREFTACTLTIRQQRRLREIRKKMAKLSADNEIIDNGRIMKDDDGKIILAELTLEQANAGMRPVPRLRPLTDVELDQQEDNNEETVDCLIEISLLSFKRNHADLTKDMIVDMVDMSDLTDIMTFAFGGRIRKRDSEEESGANG